MSGTEHHVSDVALEGRVDDLETIRRLLRSANGQALVIVGEPGVGKTTLLDAVSDEAKQMGSRVIRAAGVEFEADVSFSALNQLLLPLVADLSTLAADQRDSLMVALGLGSGMVPGRAVVSNAVLQLLGRRSAIQPLFIVVDDLQWIDRASAAVLSYVTRRLVATNVTFLGAARPSDEYPFEAGGTAQHILGPLDAEASRRLLNAKFPSLARAVGQRLLAEAQGNPLALLELPSALSDSERTAKQPLPQWLPLSRRLQSIFASRILKLPRMSRWLLLVAALDGSGDLRALREIGGERFARDIEPCERSQLLHVDPVDYRVTFRHPLIRSAVVEQATLAERQRAHSRLAEALADDQDRSIWHLSAATSDPNESVAQLLEDAAHRLLAHGDPVNALSAIVRSADLSPNQVDGGRRLSEAAYLGISGEFRNVSDLLDDVRHADPSLTESLHFASAAAYVMVNGDGDVKTAHELLVVALQSAPKDADREAFIVALNTLGYMGYLGGQKELWDSFHRIIESRLPNVPEDVYLYDRNMDPLRSNEESLRRLDEAIRGLREELDQWRIVAVSGTASSVDRLAGCREALWRVVRDGRDGKAPGQACSALTMLCFDDYHIGFWDELESLGQEGLRLVEEHGISLNDFVFRYHLAMCAAARGDYERALSLAQDMARWGAPRGVRLAQASAHQVRALVAMGQGEFELAYHHSNAVSPAGTLASYLPQTLWVALDLVESGMKSGHQADVAAHVDAMGRAGMAAISPRLALVYWGAAALISPLGEAENAYETALGTPGATRWTFEYARMQLLYGEYLRRNRAFRQSRALLGEAEEAFSRLGAKDWAHRAAQELRATGKSRTPAADRHRVDLTPQEQQIALLAASGLSNKEIGQRLSVSPRTVGGHLYRLFPKLGITSRAALRDALDSFSVGDRG